MSCGLRVAGGLGAALVLCLSALEALGIDARHHQLEQSRRRVDDSSTMPMTIVG